MPRPISPSLESSAMWFSKNFCVFRLDLDCLLNGLYANELLPSVDGIVQGFLGIVGHLCSKGL